MGEPKMPQGQPKKDNASIAREVRAENKRTEEEYNQLELLMNFTESFPERTFTLEQAFDEFPALREKTIEDFEPELASLVRDELLTFDGKEYYITEKGIQASENIE